MYSRYASIKGMNSYVFNEKTGRYEQVKGFLTGKTSTQIAEEYGITWVRTRQYALEKKLPYLGEVDKVYLYVFDAGAEEAFSNRKVKRGPEAQEKPPKIPGIMGRPRMREPVDPMPKKPVGRPRKYPIESLDIVPKRGRSQPKKK
jgi:hypothetical protein